jgi:anti-sigma regulatory factor (Ser/Thr protein kinase)
VRLLDMTRAGRNPGRIIPSVLCAFADAHPCGRVRIIGEHRWASRAAMEYPVCAQQESLINIAFAGRPVTILCPYDAARLGPQTLAEAQACHPLLIDANGERASTSYLPERIVVDCHQSVPPVMGSSLAFDASNQALARQFASEHATRLGLDGDHAELKLIVGELAARSLVPGGGTGTLRIWAERGYLVCEVRHAGHISDPLADRPLADPRQPGGHGLLLVHRLSDLVQRHTCPQGTTTRVYLKLPPADETPKGPGEPARALRIRPTSPGPTPLPWQTYEALHAAERFGRYLPQDATADAARPTAANTERRSVEPVLEALTAVEALARVVDRWRTRLVRLARTRGAPWTDIGQSLGVSKQAAHERYGGLQRRQANQGSPPTGRPELPGHVSSLPPAQGT